MKIIFYISGHGYGHAVRDIEIAKSLLKNYNSEIHFRTRAPKWLFEPLLSDRVHYHDRELDFGVLQKNSFSADKKATFERYTNFIDKKEDMVENEIQFMTSIQPDLILSDITPFAFDAAEAYGKKAIAIGNFSWDWIYGDYLDEWPEYEWIVQDIKSSYAKAECLWRIPFYGDMSAFPNRQNVPLVGRRATLPVSQVRDKFASNNGTKYILLGLRKADMEDVVWQRVEAMRNTLFVAVSRDITLQNCVHLTENTIPFQELLNACDGVLSKPGYSMVSEVIINRTPIVYIPRNDFAEDPVLIDGLQKYAVCSELSQQDFYAGNWQDSFDRLYDQTRNWTNIRNDGADVIAAKISAYA